MNYKDIPIEGVASRFAASRPTFLIVLFSRSFILHSAQPSISPRLKKRGSARIKKKEPKLPRLKKKEALDLKKKEDNTGNPYREARLGKPS
jgi:hypothetical protein